jgi:hypothetical protein
MTRGAHTVLFGLVGQALRHVVPRRVALANFEIVDVKREQGDPERVLASGAATVPSYTLAVQLPAGPSQADAQLVDVDTSNGPEVGDTIQITDPDGPFEALDVQSKNPSQIRVTSPITRAYQAGSTVQGLTISAAVGVELYSFEDALDDQRPLAVRWTYTIGGATTTVHEDIRLARQNETVALGAARSLVLRRWPDLPLRLPRGLTLAALAEVAGMELEADLVRLGRDPNLTVLGRTAVPLLFRRIVYEAARSGWQPGQRDLETFVAEQEREYRSTLDGLTVGNSGVDALTLTTEATATGRDVASRSPLIAM